MTPKQIGIKLKRARKAQGLRKEAIAAKVGVTVKTVTTIEEGARGAHLSTVLAMAQMLKMKVVP